MPWRAAVLVGSLMLIFAAPAAAATYCVAPATGCGGGTYPTLAGALTQAQGTPAPDDVQLGATGYMDGPWTYDDPSGTNPVTLRGAGQFDSQLISQVGGPTLTLNNGSADNVVVFSPDPGIAVSMSGGTLSNSQVLVRSNSTGVLGSGATIDHVSIAPAGPATGNTAVVADGTTIVDSFMSTTNGVDVSNAPVTVRRATIVTKGVGLQSGWSSTAISDSLIVLNDPTAIGVHGVCDVATGTITIDAANMTVTGPVGGAGFAFRSSGGQLCGGHVAVSSSVVHGVGTTAACAPGAGTASVTFSYSDVDLAGPGKVMGTCDVPVDAGNNFLADPLFASPATLQPIPRFDSPLVDAGDPAAPGAGQPTDIRGLPRAVNGRRDVGAFEYGRRPPALSVTAEPAAAAPGETITFTATTSDLDAGDSVGVQWNFDDGGTAAGDSVTHDFTGSGTHVATATATDSAGLTTVRPVSVEVSGSASDRTPPETTITKKPKKRAKKRKATFTFSSNEAGSFECTLDGGRPAPCSSPFSAKVKPKPKLHRFSVLAIDNSGNRDASPASYAWKVRRKR